MFKNIAKQRISVTIMPNTNFMLDKLVETTGASKSALIEKAVHNFLKDKLDEDSKALAQMNFDDLPLDDEWLQIQNETT